MSQHCQNFQPKSKLTCFQDDPSCCQQPAECLGGQRASTPRARNSSPGAAGSGILTSAHLENSKSAQTDICEQCGCQHLRESLSHFRSSSKIPVIALEVISLVRAASISSGDSSGASAGGFCPGRSGPGGLGIPGPPLRPGAAPRPMAGGA